VKVAEYKVATLQLGVGVMTDPARCLLEGKDCQSIFTKSPGVFTNLIHLDITITFYHSFLLKKRHSFITLGLGLLCKILVKHLVAILTPR
jgi:hypothetical protein